MYVWKGSEGRTYGASTLTPSIENFWLRHCCSRPAACVRLLCVRTMNFKRNDLWPICLTWRLISAISRSSLKVKVVSQGSRSQEEKCSFFGCKSERVKLPTWPKSRSELETVRRYNCCKVVGAFVFFFHSGQLSYTQLCFVTNTNIHI